MAKKFIVQMKCLNHGWICHQNNRYAQKNHAIGAMRRLKKQFLNDFRVLDIKKKEVVA